MHLRVRPRILEKIPAPGRVVQRCFGRELPESEALTTTETPTPDLRNNYTLNHVRVPTIVYGIFLSDGCFLSLWVQQKPQDGPRRNLPGPSLEATHKALRARGFALPTHSTVILSAIWNKRSPELPLCYCCPGWRCVGEGRHGSHYTVYTAGTLPQH